MEVDWLKAIATFHCLRRLMPSQIATEIRVKIDVVNGRLERVQSAYADPLYDVNGLTELGWRLALAVEPLVLASNDLDRLLGRHVTLSQVLAVVAVGLTKNQSEAAKLLGIEQNSVSARVNPFQRWFPGGKDTRLFDFRQHVGGFPTPFYTSQVAPLAKALVMACHNTIILHPDLIRGKMFAPQLDQAGSLVSSLESPNAEQERSLE